MKIKKCPYCGKRISYTSTFASRRKGEYVCERCGKECKVVINKSVIMIFALAVVISLAIMGGWMLAGLLNNPLGILLTAAPLIVFAIISPNFVYFEPLRKYKKSMEAKKAGIAYSDNLLTSELDNDDSYSFPTVSNDTGGFQINSDVFNKIKAERTAEREKLAGDDIVSDSGKIEKPADSYVSVKGDVSQNYVYSDVPLKKIHSENARPVRRSNHYMLDDSEEGSTNSPSKRTDGNRYSSNRRF